MESGQEVIELFSDSDEDEPPDEFGVDLGSFVFSAMSHILILTVSGSRGNASGIRSPDLAPGIFAFLLG
jgi:hypothetical protein